MPFIGNQSLTALLQSETVIKPFNPINLKNGAYELTLGDEVFLTDSDPRIVRQIEFGEQIRIAAGQFALLLTEESLNMPLDKIGFISIKASIKFKGLVNVSGFHVDPGFKGKLLFSVYNAGPSEIIMSRGEAYFPIWFAHLDSPQEYHGTHKDQKRIPDEVVERLSQGNLASPSVLSSKIDENNKDLERKISLLEKDQKANNYIAASAFSLVAVIFIKFIFDWAFLDLSFDHGYMSKDKETKSQSVIEQLQRDNQELKDKVKNLEKNIIFPTDSNR